MIDEKKLISELNKNSIFAKVTNAADETVYNIIQRMPKVGEWIPCSERLPEERNWYLAMFKEPDTDFMGLPMIADYLMGLHTNYTTEDGWIIANCTDTETAEAEYYKKLKCVAWMPLPEPYKEQNNG